MGGRQVASGCADVRLHAAARSWREARHGSDHDHGAGLRLRLVSALHSTRADRRRLQRRSNRGLSSGVFIVAAAPWLASAKLARSSTRIRPRPRCWSRSWERGNVGNFAGNHREPENARNTTGTECSIVVFEVVDADGNLEVNRAACRVSSWCRPPWLAKTNP